MFATSPSFVKSLALSLHVLAAIFFWLIFSPAFMSVDGLYQYAQALSGNFDDWHPPIMSITLFLLLKCGLGLKTLLFFQSLLGSLGCYALTNALLKSFFQDNLSDTQRNWISMAVFALLISPLSPLPFYLMTFGKTSWVAILLMWAMALGLNLLRSQKTDRLFILRLCLFFLALALCVNVRYNAVVIIPLALALIFIILKRAHMKYTHFLARRWAKT